MSNDDIIISPEVPGPRYVINKTMAWFCILLVAMVAFFFGVVVGIAGNALF